MRFPAIEHLPMVRGTYTANAPLKHLVWFRVGGPAQVLFRPKDVEDLAFFLKNKPADVPVMTIGVGSNLLIRDGGIPGVVIRLPAAFGRVQCEGTRIRAGAMVLDSVVARSAAQAGIAGLEFMRGIPGTVGGALTMNAGCYGREIRDILVSATMVLPDGEIREVSADEMGFTYRHSNPPEGAQFVEAVFEGEAGDAAEITERMNALLEKRKSVQPIRERTGGSTFKNPPDGNAWKLIDRAGCRGFTVGGAQVSDMHCNFLINTGTATAEDIETLGEEVRSRVKEATGVTLEWEIKRVGVS